MPTITPGSGASFDKLPPPVAEPEGEVKIEITGPDDGDAVEIGGAPPPRTTYGPPRFGDRFRFAIQNGMLENGLRYNANEPRSRGANVVTYEQRQDIGTQVAKASGPGSPSSALFAIQIQDADPENREAPSQVEGRSEFSRQADRNLSLLSSL